LLNVTFVVNATGHDNREIRYWFQGKSGSIAIIEWQRRMAIVATGNPGSKLAMYKPFKPQSALLPHRVPTC
jgi:hypothetical protein